MRRDEIVQAVKAVEGSLHDAGLPILFDDLMRSRENKVEPEKIMSSFYKFVAIHRAFGVAELKIMAIFGLERLNDTSFWAQLMGDDVRNQEVFQVSGSIHFAVTHLPEILDLIRRDNEAYFKKRAEQAGVEREAYEELKVIVIEDDQISSAERLVLVLQSIGTLYKACAQLISETDDVIAVTACDSGSDKSFDFLGVAKVVEMVKDIILSFWDKVVYFREDKTGRKLDLITQSLPILEQITDMSESGKISPESAELIKRDVVAAISQFSRAGATIPEIDDVSRFNPRVLMRPEPMMLVASHESKDVEQVATTTNTAEDVMQIEDPKFMAHMKKMAREFLTKEEKKSDSDVTDDIEENIDEPDGVGAERE